MAEDRRPQVGFVSGGETDLNSARGQGGDEETAMCRVKLRKDVIEEQNRRLTRRVFEQIEFGKLERDDREPLLSAGTESP